MTPTEVLSARMDKQKADQHSAAHREGLLLLHSLPPYLPPYLLLQGLYILYIDDTAFVPIYCKLESDCFLYGQKIQQDKVAQ